ncbi:MAG: RNA-binding protein [Candidatus Nomurabacteria bacterium]|jgi:RNA recognition motif-containing protein|nr:RNA-binding protein [Candidatus Nomurabacteria bacterium]
MAAKLYVGGLSNKVSEEELTSLFATRGKVVSSKIERDEKTGNSKGFAFVEMKDEVEARRALNELHGTKLYGSIIVISWIKNRG